MEIWAVETVTGNRLGSIPFTALSGEAILNDAGTVDVTVPLRKLPPRTRAEVVSYLRPGRCSLAAVTDSGDVLEAGPIWRRRFNDRSGSWSIGASGLWSIFDKRKMVPTSWSLGDKVQDEKISLAGTWQQIVSAVVAESLARTGGTLPVVSAASAVGDVQQRVYPGYEMKWVGDVLREINAVSGGPDIAFQPRVRADGNGIEWVLRIGAPMLTQTGSDWIWDRGAVRGGLLEIDVDEDATGVAQRAWAMGNGSDTGLLIGVAEFLEPLSNGYPLTEVEAAVSTVTTNSEIAGHALSALSVAERPWQTWTFSARDTNPELGQYRPGDWASIIVPSSHLVLPAGATRTRILSFGWDQSRSVSVRVAPVKEAR